MANPERARMLELGQWLEKCLHPNIKPLAINRLFNEGLKIIGVTHQKIQPSKIIESIKLNSNQTIYEYLEPLTPKVGEYEDLQLRLFDFKVEQDSRIEAHLAFEQFLEDNPHIQIEKDTYFFFSTLNCVHSVFKELYKNHVPWQKALQILDKDERYHNTIHSLKNDFPNVGQAIIETDGRIKISKGINPGIQMNDTEWCYKIVLSNIFFEFLLLGGQDHFKFCEYCGAFTVIRRKDSKKFCSDRCRAHHRLDEIAKSE